jgi:hypothetical protein
MITEALSSNGRLAPLFRLLGGVYQSVALQWTPGSNSATAALRRHVTVVLLKFLAAIQVRARNIPSPAKTGIRYLRKNVKHDTSESTQG